MECFGCISGVCGPEHGKPKKQGAKEAKQAPTRHLTRSCLGACSASPPHEDKEQEVKKKEGSRVECRVGCFVQPKSKVKKTRRLDTPTNVWTVECMHFFSPCCQEENEKKTKTRHSTRTCGMSSSWLDFDFLHMDPPF